MKKFTIKTMDLYTVESIVCDKCKKEYKRLEDFGEFQEIRSIDFIGGYASIFGDMADVKVDLCQHCLYTLIGDIANVTKQE